MLAPLNDNGGVGFTHALLGNSTAIDAGDDAVLGPPHNLMTDQRFDARRIGLHVDIGAFEYDPPQLGPNVIVNLLTEHNDGVCGTSDCTLSEAVGFANMNADANTITFKPGLSGMITTLDTPDGMVISGPVTIQGPGARILTITGSNAGRIFGIEGGPTTISGLTLANGRYDVVGGAAIVSIANLTLTNCRLDNNVTTGAGGAIWNGGPLALNNCTFTANVANGTGGAIHNMADSFAHGNVTAINCTFFNNLAFSGGALSNKTSGATGVSLLRNCTISGNAARFGGVNKGGGLVNLGTAGSTVRIENSIVAANISDDGSPDVFGVITSGGSNLVGDATGATGLTNGVNSDQVGTTAAPINPQLAAIANNGGPTDTRALLANSPAINTGNNALAPPADQRGFGRAGVSDRGSFEFNGIAPPPAPVTVVARKMHGALGPFDIDLLALAPPRTECRTGGAGGIHQVVATFAEAVTVTGVSVTSIDNMATATVSVNGAVVTINLASVTNRQTAAITLLGVSNGTGTGNVAISFPVLLGDTNGNGAVTSSDIGQTKARSGQPVSAANFRTDVNANGAINSSDIGQVKAQSGATLP